MIIKILWSYFLFQVVNIEPKSIFEGESQKITCTITDRFIHNYTSSNIILKRFIFQYSFAVYKYCLNLNNPYRTSWIQKNETLLNTIIKNNKTIEYFVNKSSIDDGENYECELQNYESRNHFSRVISYYYYITARKNLY